MRSFLSFLLTQIRDWIVTRYFPEWGGGGDCDNGGSDGGGDGGGTPTIPGGETIDVGNQSGVFEGGTGNDTITANHSSPAVSFVLNSELTNLRTEDYSISGYWVDRSNQNRIWNPEGPIPAAGLRDGLTVLRGGAGDDSITATGNSIDADGGAGDDILIIHGGAKAMCARGGEGDDTMTVTGTYVVVAGGAGDDSITANGTLMTVNAGAGDDFLRISGSGMTVSGGEGADTIDVSGMTSGWVRLDGDDIVTGQSLSSSGVIFDLVLNADFQGSGAGEYVFATGGSVVDGMGGDDTLRVTGYNEAGSTLNGGGGNDVIDGTELHYDYIEDFDRVVGIRHLHLSHRAQRRRVAGRRGAGPHHLRPGRHGQRRSGRRYPCRLCRWRPDGSDRRFRPGRGLAATERRAVVQRSAEWRHRL